MKGRRVALVTGAQGFVGRYLVDELLAGDPKLEVVGVGRSDPTTTFTHEITAGNARVRAPLPAELRRAFESKRYQYRQLDLREAKRVRSLFEEYAPEYVYHLASGLRDDSPEHLFSTGVDGTIALLHAAADAPAIPQAVVIASSGSVYGLPRQLPIAETHACEPRDYYAVCKLAQEHVSRIIARERTLPLRIGRIFNVVGPGQDERHAAGRFCAQISAAISGNSERKIVVGDLTPTRDFVDVRDTASGLLAIANPRAPNDTYNIASGIESSIQIVLDSLLRITNLDGEIAIDRAYVRASDTPRSYADITKLRSLGFNPKFRLERSLRDLLTYYQTLS